MPAIRPTLTCAFMVVKSQRHGVTRSYSRRNCASGRADTLFSSGNTLMHCRPVERCLESRSGGYLSRFCKSQQSGVLRVLPQVVMRERGTLAHFLTLRCRLLGCAHHLHPEQTQSGDLVLGWLVPRLRSLFLTEGCFAFCASFFDSRTTSA